MPKIKYALKQKKRDERNRSACARVAGWLTFKFLRRVRRPTSFTDGCPQQHQYIIADSVRQRRSYDPAPPASGSNTPVSHIQHLFTHCYLCVSIHWQIYARWYLRRRGAHGPQSLGRVETLSLEACAAPKSSASIALSSDTRADCRVLSVP